MYHEDLLPLKVWDGEHSEDPRYNCFKSPRRKLQEQPPLSQAKRDTFKAIVTPQTQFPAFGGLIGVGERGFSEVLGCWNPHSSRAVNQ